MKISDVKIGDVMMVMQPPSTDEVPDLAGCVGVIAAVGVDLMRQSVTGVVLDPWPDLRFDPDDLQRMGTPKDLKAYEDSLSVKDLKAHDESEYIARMIKKGVFKPEVHIRWRNEL